MRRRASLFAPTVGSCWWRCEGKHFYTCWSWLSLPKRPTVRGVGTPSPVVGPPSPVPIQSGRLTVLLDRRSGARWTSRIGRLVASHSLARERLPAATGSTTVPYVARPFTFYRRRRPSLTRLYAGCGMTRHARGGGGGASGWEGPSSAWRLTPRASGSSWRSSPSPRMPTTPSWPSLRVRRRQPRCSCTPGPHASHARAWRPGNVTALTC